MPLNPADYVPPLDPSAAVDGDQAELPLDLSLPSQAIEWTPADPEDEVSQDL